MAVTKCVSEFFTPKYLQMNKLFGFGINTAKNLVYAHGLCKFW